MKFKESLLLLGILVALLCIPVAIAATGGGGPDEPYYIKVVLDEPKEYRNLEIETIDILDPLNPDITLVTLESTEDGDLKFVKCPSLGSITREFSPASGYYRGANITVTENKTISCSTLPNEYVIYIKPTIPSFTMNIPGRSGNPLLIKIPESKNADFAEIFSDTDMEAYLFTDKAIVSIKEGGENITYFGGISSDQIGQLENLSDLSSLLDEFKFTLSSFTTKATRAQDMMEEYSHTRPKAGEYLLTAVEYDSNCSTIHVLAAMPVIILDGDTPVTWSGDAPHSWDKGATISFDGNIDVDKIAYALVKEDPTYSLQVKINTSELANQSLPTSGTDAISVLRSIARKGALEEYTLICDNNK